MKEPLIIKSTFYNISPKDLEELRQNIKRQMQEENPVIVLPCGFEIANVNTTELLEKLKQEIKEPDAEKWLIGVDIERGYEVGIEHALKKIDAFIAELKGETE